MQSISRQTKNKAYGSTTLFMLLKCSETMSIRRKSQKIVLDQTLTWFTILTNDVLRARTLHTVEMSVAWTSKTSPVDQLRQHQDLL